MKQVNTKPFLSLIAIAVLLIASCRKNPQFQSIVTQGASPSVGFSYAVSDTNALVVTFKNLSQNASTYYWQFGDGTTSTDTLPTHVYVTSGRYTVKLVARSSAGYSSDTSMPVIAAAPATSGFTTTASGVLVSFNNTSVSMDSCVWDFGDNSAESRATAPSHVYPSAGQYDVTLTVYGIAGDVVKKTETITVSGNCISGGGFESGDAQYWKVWSSQASIPPVFGYTADKPSGGSGGCLEFPSFADAANGNGLNELIYQQIYVQAGKQYQFSAKVKVPAGGTQCYLQFYLSDDPNTWSENAGAPPTQLFVSLNTWRGWNGYDGWQSTSALDGDMMQLVHANGDYGPYAATNGVYTASTTGYMYLGIQAGTWEGKSNGPYLVDNVSFTQMP